MCSHLQIDGVFGEFMSIWRVDTQIVKKVSIIQTLIWNGKWILIEDLISIMKSLWWEPQDGVLECSFCFNFVVSHETSRSWTLKNLNFGRGL
jgi:hypothetical protein